MDSKATRNIWVLTAAALTVTVGYFILIYLPAQKAIAAMEAEVCQKKACLDTADSLISALTAASGQLVTARQFVAAWNELCPIETALPSLYGRIHELAAKCGANVTHFEPKPPQIYESLEIVPVGIDCSGSYSQVHDFMAELEQLDVPIWIDTVQIKKAGENESAVVGELSLAVFSRGVVISN